MKHYVTAENGPYTSKAHALLFGYGLLGSNIGNHLVRQGWHLNSTHPFSWNDENLRTQQGTEIAAALLQSQHPGTPVSLIWAAGKAGPTSPTNELEHELHSFQTGLQMAGELSKAVPVRFHLVSSAGGLFEGQRFIDRNASPAPISPYGHSKAEQERALIALSEETSGHITTDIYRPSTVYGYQPHGRHGLVTVLALNSLQGKVTNVYGSPLTLRDYVTSDDIGRFIANRVSEALDVTETACSTWLLASGKPTQTEELISLVKQAIKRPVLLQYSTQPTNALDNTFRKSAIAPGFRSTAVSTGVTMLVDAVRQTRLSKPS